MAAQLAAPHDKADDFSRVMLLGLQTLQTIYIGVYLHSEMEIADMPDDITTDAPQVAKPPQGIAVSGAGVLTPVSHDEVWRQVSIWHKSGLCPESFKSPAQVFFAHQTLASLGVNPLSWLRFTGYIKNSLSIFGDLPLALVNLNKKLSRPPLEYFLDKDYKEICIGNKNLHAPVWAAVCRMWPAGGDDFQERAYTVQDAETAGKLPARAPSPWFHYRKRMMALKARGWLIKDLFPEILNGVAQGEYDHDEMSQSFKSAKRIDVAQANDAAVNLNETYGGDA